MCIFYNVCIYYIVLYICCALSENDEIKMINQSIDVDPRSFAIWDWIILQIFSTPLDPPETVAPAHECVPAELSGPNGTIQSPNYPHHYPSDSDCEWKIQVEETQVKLP